MKRNLVFEVIMNDCDIFFSGERSLTLGKKSRLKAKQTRMCQVALDHKLCSRQSSISVLSQEKTREELQGEGGAPRLSALKHLQHSNILEVWAHPSLITILGGKSGGGRPKTRSATD